MRFRLINARYVSLVQLNVGVDSLKFVLKYVITLH